MGRRRVDPGADALGYVPVGADFPVFLHPKTKECALARTERKTAAGYHGFAFRAPDVTLEEDLQRRDLTINAMARAPDGAIIDPWGGQRDLNDRVLRHVSPAFAEDPVRLLRIARSRFTDFSIAAETAALMRTMVGAGEADALVPERVWKELSRGLMEARPSRMFEVLRSCGALARVLPEVDRLWGVPQRADYHPEVDTGVHLMMVLDMAARLEAPLSVRYACLCHDLGKARRRPRHCRGISGTRSAASSSRARSATACASARRAASSPRSSPASTATSTAAPGSARQRCCACSNAATRCAGPIALPKCCSPANATPAAGSAWRRLLIRSDNGCCGP